MKRNDFSDAIRRTPVFVPVFRVIKVPAWAKDYVQVGQLLAFSPVAGDLRTRKGLGYQLGATYVEFVEYLTHRDFYSPTIPDSVIEASLPPKVL